MSKARRGGFTLIEVLIVVVIMAVLAATIIPQFSSSTRDAKSSALTFNQHTLRSQIEMYKIQHQGSYPAVTNNDLPTLYKNTDVTGAVGTGANYPYGPYIDGGALPANPYDNKNRVVSVSLSGAKPTAVADSNGGWQYDPTTGDIWPNNADYFNQTQGAY